MNYTIEEYWDVRREIEKRDPLFTQIVGEAIHDYTIEKLQESKKKFQVLCEKRNLAENLIDDCYERNR